MDVIIERACGLDIHEDNITACIMTTEGKEIQTFSTKTVFLLKLRSKRITVLTLPWKALAFIGNQLLTY